MTILTVLYGSIQNEEWDGARLLLRPYTSVRGDCPEKSNDRKQILQDILKQSRDSLGAALMHFACGQPNIPTDIVEKILDAADFKPKEKPESSCHSTVVNSKKAVDALIECSDHAGFTLVHYAAASGESTTLAALLHRLPWLLSPPLLSFSPLRVSCSRPYGPCRLAWYCFFRKRPQPDVEDSIISSNRTLKERISQLLNSYDHEKLEGMVCNLWRKTMLLAMSWIRARNWSSRLLRCLEQNPVAALIFCNGRSSDTLSILDCPSVAVWFAFQIGNYDLLKPMLGSDKKSSDLFLHFAASIVPDQSDDDDRQVESMIPPRTEEYISRQANGDVWNEYAHRSVLTQLCYLEPLAAKVPNKQCQLPLHIAIDSGQSWSDCIDVLLQAYPEAIAILDPTTGLEPLLQAANAKRCSLTTLFEMIRHNADLLFVSDDDEE